MLLCGRAVPLEQRNGLIAWYKVQLGQLRPFQKGTQMKRSESSTAYEQVAELFQFFSFLILQVAGFETFFDLC